MKKILKTILIANCLTILNCLTNNNCLILDDISIQKASAVYYDSSYSANYIDGKIEVYIDDIFYLAQCVEAESGNQDELGRAYVCDCILNRADLYNTTYTDIINQEGQFDVVNNGRINIVPSETTLKIVYEELQNRKNYDIIYFRTEYYHTFGTPVFKYGDHYFSKR